MKARLYQDHAADAVFARFDAGDQRTMLVIPTGGGKTIIAAEIARRMRERHPEGRIMVLAHRDELIRQAAEKFAAVTGILPSIEKADERSQENSLHGKPPIVVSSFQTQISGKGARRRMHRFDPSDFSMLWVDEAHHSTAGSFRAVIEHYAQHKGCRVLGVTATADRADGEGLGQVFQSVAFRYELPEIIADGYLVPIRQNFVFIEGLDFSQVRTTAGDLNAGDTEKQVMLEKPLHGVVHATIEVACGLSRESLSPIRDEPDRCGLLDTIIGGNRRRRVLVFAVTVRHAERMAEIFNRWIPDSADFISGAMSMDRRRDALKKFHDGRLQFLVNCQVATEGFDEPGVEIVAVARPTKSRALYTQMVGRSTRPAAALAPILGTLDTPEERRAAIHASAKPYAEVLDYVGNSGRHQLVSTLDLLGCAFSAEQVELAREYMKTNGASDTQAALEWSKEEVERKRRESAERQRKRDEDEANRRAAAARERESWVATARYGIEQRDPFDSFAVRVNREQVAPEINGIPTKTVEYLLKNKVKEQEIRGMNATLAKRLAQQITARHKAGLCSYAQAKVLKGVGYSREELHAMKRADASNAIEAAKANGWRRAEKVA